MLDGYEVDTIELKKLMIENGIETLEGLKAATNINRNTLSEVINGKAYPSSMVMVQIGKALKMSSSQMGSIFFKPKLA